MSYGQTDHAATRRGRLTTATASVKPREVKREWWLIDATNAVPGRLATVIVKYLCGKHKAVYTPHVNGGDHVVVINAEKIQFTGNKLEEKTLYHHSGYPGGIKARGVRAILEGKHPERVLWRAVWGMMARGPLAESRIKCLHLYTGSDHPHHGQQPEFLDIVALNRKNVVAPRAAAASERVPVMSDQFAADIRKILEEGLKPVVDSVSSLKQDFSSVTDAIRKNADDLNDHIRQFRGAQDATNMQLDATITRLDASNAQLVQIEADLKQLDIMKADLGEIRKNTENMATAINALVVQLSPKP